MPSPSPDVPELVARARAGDQRSVGRLISMVEDASPQLREVAALLAPHTGRAQVVGLTGAPGVGKSTATSTLVSALRRQGKRVGVLAVDPTSPLSGGALLGDRIRMGEHATDDGVFIRSMAARGHLGGLSWATPQAIRVMDAAGCEVIVVETVGVGQSEYEVASLADTTVVLVAPGMGDSIQAGKAGLLEVADVIAVNKADRDGADQTVRELRYMLSLAGKRTRDGDSWVAPILRTVAVHGDGLDELVAALDEHRGWLDRSGERERRRRRRAQVEIEAITLERLRAKLGDPRGAEALTDLAARVMSGDLDPYAAADELSEAVQAG